MRKQIAAEVGPELVVTLPGHPVGGPARLGVGSEHGRAAQPVLPAREQRIAVQSEDGLRRRLGDEPRVALERRRRLDAGAVENFRPHGDGGRERFLHRGGAGVLHHVLQQNLLQAGRLIQEVGPAAGGHRDLVEISAVHVLAQAHCGDGDLFEIRFARKLHAVAFFRDAVGQQHDMLVRRVGRQNAAIGFVERGRDLRAAVGGDAGDQPLDQRAVLSAADRNGPLVGVVEDQHAHQVDGPKIIHHADRRQPRQLDLAPLHRRALVDDQHHGRPLG